LSVTPERWFDPDGTKSIFDYFDKTVFKFPLEESIGIYLTEYEYHPYFITLTEEEIEKYEKKSKKIAKAYFNSKNNKEKEEYY
jgi:superfamily II DNA or RNA helicase